MTSITIQPARGYPGQTGTSQAPGPRRSVIPAAALSAELVHLVLTRVGLAEEEVRRLTKPAIARIGQYWTQGD
jgi:hypothetical protein